MYRKDITRLTLTEKTSQNYKAVTVSYHNPKTGKKVTATAKNKEGVKGDTLKINARCENKQQALLRAKAALANGNHICYALHILIYCRLIMTGAGLCRCARRTGRQKRTWILRAARGRER